MRAGSVAAALLLSDGSCRVYLGSSRIKTVPERPVIDEPLYSPDNNGQIVVSFIGGEPQDGGAGLAGARLYSEAGTMLSQTDTFASPQQGTLYAVFDDLLANAPELTDAIEAAQEEVLVRVSLGNAVGWSMVSAPALIAQ